MCEQYRDEMMALLDGELNTAEENQVKEHLQRCPICNTEYREFEKLNHLARVCSFACPGERIWSNYWEGVCFKLKTRTYWKSWVAGSAVMIGAGTLMLSGFNENTPARILGVSALCMGVGILWLSYYCNCREERS